MVMNSKCHRRVSTTFCLAFSYSVLNFILSLQ